MRIPGKHNTPDVLERNEGTVFVFCPLTDRARAWIDENVQTETWQWVGNALVVEYRYAWGLATGTRLCCDQKVSPRLSFWYIIPFVGQPHQHFAVQRKAPTVYLYYVVHDDSFQRRSTRATRHISILKLSLCA